MPARIAWTVERMLERTVRNERGCALWQGHVAKDTGYGQVYQTIDGREKKVGAHRFMAKLAHGEPPTPEHEACHECDNRPCIEPSHLFWGTSKENTEDMVRKGRNAKGSRHPAARLTEAQVAKIKAAPSTRGSGRRLAKQYGVSPSTISAIRLGQNWKGTSIGTEQD